LTRALSQFDALGDGKECLSSTALAKWSGCRFRAGVVC